MKNKQKSENILVIQKYTGAKVGIISTIIALCISTICYVMVLYLLGSGTLSSELNTLVCIFRDVLLAIVSIVGTSLLTSIFIEKNRKNVDYTEMLANDIFASPEFYSNLTEDNKKKMYKYLEENLYHKNFIKSELYQKCRDRLYSIKSEYYYTELNMSVSYFDCNTYSEKTIKRIMKMRSYGEDIQVQKLLLFSYNLSPTQGVKNFEVLSSGIGEKNEVLKIGKDILIEKKETRDLLLDKCGYKETYEVYLCKPITLYAEKDTILNIEYVSRVADEDMSVGFGVMVPCKKFYLNFIAPPNYVVYAHSYGFFNMENNYANSSYRNNVTICFDNWLLPGEGVALAVAQNSTNSYKIKDVI